MAMKIAEMFYTLRNRVRQSGESVPNFVGFSGSSGMKIPFSTLKNKRTVSYYAVVPDIEKARGNNWRFENINGELKRFIAELGYVDWLAYRDRE